MIVFDVVLVALVVCLIAAAVSVRVVRQFERGVVFRFGRVLPEIRQPGLVLLVPDRYDDFGTVVDACRLIATVGATHHRPHPRLAIPQ